MDSLGDVAGALRGYEILETLGRGGFGTVYRARQVAVGREVALKIDGRVLATERDRRRFMREVTAAGQLSGHPNVVAVYDAGVLDDGRPYMVLELCPQGSLSDRLNERGPFPPAEVRDIGVNIADALAAAHSAGVLHRDVKPANILVNRYGVVALADFGLAVIPTPGLESSATREALTPAYASPEAFNLAEPTPAGDVYALGATLYALLSGRPPYFPPGGSPSLVALMAARLGPVPDIPGAPPALVDVLRRAMAYESANRPSGAAELRDALAAVDLSATTTPTAPVTRAAPVPQAPGPYASGPQGAGPYGPVPQATGPQGNGPTAGEARDWITTAPPNRRPKSSGGLNGALLAAAIVVSVGVIGAGGLVAYSIAGGSSERGGAADGGVAAAPTAQAKDAYGGAETTEENCPATAVAGAHARCTKTAECWGGIVSMNGDVTINRSDCAIAHPYETFAIAPLPSDAQTWNEHTLSRHPAVRQVCSRDVMARSRYGDALRYAPDKWSIEVVPPSQAQFDGQGLRAFRCVATITGRQVTGGMFRPRG